MKNLIKSLINFQLELPPIEKNALVKVQTKNGGGYSLKYADLTNIIDVCRPLLNKHELVLWQGTRVENNITYLITKLMHVSGEEIVSEMTIPHTDDPQKFGGFLTYFKRYQISSVLNISADEDDDGNQVASNSKSVEITQKSFPPKIGGTSFEKQKASDAQLSFVRKIIKDNSLSNTIDEINNMSKEDANIFIKKYAKQN